MIRSALASAVSGLTAAGAAFEVSAASIARLSTDVEAPLRGALSEDGGVRVTLSPEARAGARDDLVDAMVGQQLAVRAYQANLVTLKAADEVAGVLVHLGESRGG